MLKCRHGGLLTPAGSALSYKKLDYYWLSLAMNCKQNRKPIRNPNNSGNEKGKRDGDGRVRVRVSS